MLILKLKGKTTKGKNRCRELGSYWNVLEERDNIEVCNGPGIMIASVQDTSGSGGQFPKSSRWICKVNDPDFEIVSETRN